MSKSFRFLLLALGMIACLVIAPVGAKENVVGDQQATASAQALKFYQSLRDQDYKAMYYLLAVTERGKATFGTEDEFARDVKKGYDASFATPEEKIASDKLLNSISDIVVGEAVITGNKAVVPTSAKITINEKVYSFKGEAFMIQDEGVWKLDLTFDESSEKAMAQRTSELLGKPVQ